MLDDNKLKNLNVPPLRFPEFSGEWDVLRLGDRSNVLMCKRIMAAQTNTEEGVPFYKIGTIGTNADAYISKELFDEYKSKYPFPRKGEVMITCAGTVGKCIIYDGKDSYYQDSNIVWIDNPDETITNGFLFWLLSKINWSYLNSTTIVRIYNDDLRNLKLSYPEFNEQQKITRFLSLINERINTQRKIIEELKKLKSAINSALLINDCWDEYTIGDLCESISTKQYICPSVSEDGIYPIIQQGENPVVGYTKSAPFKDYNKVVLFGDHTLSTYRPCTPFLLSTDGIKILAPNPQIIRDFLYYLLEAFKPQPEGYKRHYSILKDVRVHVPPIAKQESIVRGLIEIDLKQNVESRILSLLQLQKQYLLTQMFI